MCNKMVFVKMLMLFLLAMNSFASTQLDMIDKDWLINELGDQIINMENYNTEKPHITFYQDNRFSAWAGCNRISGAYNFTAPDKLQFPPNIIITRMACSSPQNIEDKFVAILPEVQTMIINEQSMQLLSKDGSVLAVLGMQ